LPNKSIVFFDGNCGLCDRSVRFIMSHDHRKEFFYCPLQSELAQENVPKKLLDSDTVVLFENGVFYSRSVAAFKILRKLATVWQLLLVFRFLPLSFTDAVYQFVARNRKKWFPTPSTCHLPSPEVRERVFW